MRPSKRSEILDAALDVVERAGVTAATFESVSAAAGITKGGLLYHFPSREALVRAMHEHLAERWEAQLEAAAGSACADTSAADRCRAYTAVATESATRAELLLMLDASATADTDDSCLGVIERWAAPAPDATATPTELDPFIARLAADGLWLHDAIAGRTLDPAVRRLVADRLANRGDAGAAVASRVDGTPERAVDAAAANAERPHGA